MKTSRQAILARLLPGLDDLLRGDGMKKVSGESFDGRSVLNKRGVRFFYKMSKSKTIQTSKSMAYLDLFNEHDNVLRLVHYKLENKVRVVNLSAVLDASSQLEKSDHETKLTLSLLALLD